MDAPAEAELNKKQKAKISSLTDIDVKFRLFSDHSNVVHALSCQLCL